MDLKLAYFYPSLMNLYGDRGNVQTLQKRCEWRGIHLDIVELGLGDAQSLNGFDLGFFGGGQDKEQLKIGADLLQSKAENVIAAIQDSLVMLAVCGGYQLLGEYYRPVQGEILPGIGLLDARTEGGTIRAIGNIVINSFELGKTNLQVVGFENHSGRTFLGPGCRALGKVIRGYGNNGHDGYEGARYLNCFGTYMHGPLLPKNPAFADYLIQIAVERKYGKKELSSLDDKLEEETRKYVIHRVQKRSFWKGKKG